MIMDQFSMGATAINFGLVVVDMQNGFVSKGGSYDHLGMNILELSKDHSKSKGTYRLLQKQENTDILHRSR